MIYTRLDVSFPSRAALFKRSLWSGKTRNVVYFYERPDTSTFRYRGYNICQAVESSPVVRAHFFFSHEIPLVRPDLRGADAFVFIRMPWTPLVEGLISELHALGKRVHFDIDDLVFDDRYLTLVMNTLGYSMDDDASINVFCAYMNRLNKTAGLCDGFTCTNQYLAGKLHERYGRVVQIVPNLMNREQAAISEQLYARGRPRARGFRVGYFSGTPSHNNDFYGVASEIADFLERRTDAALVIVGYLNLPPTLAALAAAGRITCEPFKDYVALQESIWAADVNIVPLMVNDFTNCKSELKYFEAAAVGVPTIASRTHAYCAAIRDRENGMLCEQGEWLRAFETAYAGWHPDPGVLVADARSRYLNEARRGDIETVLRAL